MTPKEKAEELVGKYFKLLNYEFGDLVYSLNDKQPHQCALIAVDEMVSESARMKSSYMGRKRYEYLLEVKQEIEKL